MPEFQFQKAFDLVSQHLISQATRAFQRGRCVYRHENGTRCAIGMLMKDECYGPQLEGLGANNVKVVSVLRDSGWNIPPSYHGEYPRVMEFLRSLQYLHDQIEPRLWMEGLNEMASMFELTLFGVHRTSKYPQAKREHRLNAFLMTHGSLPIKYVAGGEIPKMAIESWPTISVWNASDEPLLPTLPSSVPKNPHKFSGTPFELKPGFKELLVI